MRLSIIIPIYNVEEFLNRCLDSIIQISITNIEIILVNDGSTDNSKMICEDYLKLDKRLKLINQENFGLSHARNIGLEYASGRYIAFVDSDDWIDAKGLMKLLEVIEKDGLDIVYGEYSHVKGEETQKVLKKYNKDICSGIQILDSNLKKDSVPVEVVTNIYKKEFLDRHSIRFVEGLLHEDVLFSFTCYLYAEKAKCLPITFYYYFIREGSIMRTVSLKNYLYKLYIIEKLQQMKEEHKIHSLAWDTVIFSMYFNSVRDGKIKNKQLHTKITNNQNLTFRSKIKKILLLFLDKSAEEVNYENLLNEYLSKEKR